MLASTDWEFKYPKVQALTTHISDHTPLLLDTRDSCPATQKHMLKFELSGFIREDLYGIVEKIWQEENKGHTPLERWQNKIRCLRQYLRGWANNQNRAYRKEKKELTERIEMTVLQQHEVDLKHCLKEH
jgi:hypothetical protein